VSIPRKGHKDIGDQQQKNGEHVSIFLILDIERVRS
jgi:hypothetical protein